MTQVWIYSVSSSNDPDNVRCVVPWRVDNDLIFFGPCKRRIRERLRKRFLSEYRGHCKVNDDVFIVGVNGGNKERIRKVVWAGKLSEAMTFADAYKRLKGSRFRELRDDKDSPLHVRPIKSNDGDLVGYEHRSSEHIADDLWVSDLVSRSRSIRLRGRRLLLPFDGKPWEVFDRDCCMLLENVFFAQGQGIAFDTDALNILRSAQPEKSGIDRYAIFGLTANGQANGLRGQYLTIEGELSECFVAWLEDRASGAATSTGAIAFRKTPCSSTPRADKGDVLR